MGWLSLHPRRLDRNGGVKHQNQHHNRDIENACNGLYLIFRKPFYHPNTPSRRIICEHGYRQLLAELPRSETEGIAMQDLTMLFFTAVFFGLAFFYVKACQKLR